MIQGARDPRPAISTGRSSAVAAVIVLLGILACGVGPANAVERNVENGYRLGAGLALAFDDSPESSKVIAISLRTGARVDTDLQCGAADDADPVKLSSGLVLTEPSRIYLEVRVDGRGTPGTACDRIWQAGAAAGALDASGRGLLVLVSDDMGRTWLSLPRPPGLGQWNDTLAVAPRAGAVLVGDPVEGWSEWRPDRPVWTRAYGRSTFGYSHPDGRDYTPELRSVRLPRGARYFDFIGAAQGAARDWVLYGYGGTPVRRVRWRAGRSTGLARLNIPAGVTTRTAFLPNGSRCRATSQGRSNTLQQAFAQSSADGRIVWGVSGRDGVARCGRRRVGHTLRPRLILSRNYGRSWRTVRTPRAARRSVFLLAVDGTRPVITTPGCRRDNSRWWRLTGRKWLDLGCHPKSGNEDD